MPMPPDSLDDLTLQLRRFAAERDWETFHSPKNLAMALTGEAGELAAEFQWLTEAESLALDAPRKARVQEEAADVLLYLVRLADRAGFDLLEAARDSWDKAVTLGERHGYRNAQVTVLAPTGTIGLLMDCDTTGIEPDFALVKFKKLAGGGYFKIINRTVPDALRKLGYEDRQIEAIVRHAVGHGTLKDAPGVSHAKLKAKGFTADVTVRNVDKNGAAANAKSIVRILGEGLGPGTKIEIAAEGADEKAAVDALVALVDSGFGE